MRSAAAIAIAAAYAAACGGEQASSTRSIGPAAAVLTLSTSGEGAVQGLASDCRGSCTQKVALGDHVTLKAVPDAGATFAGWNGACAGAGLCNLIVEGDTSVQASFVRAQAIKRLVTVTLDGHGRVVSSPARIDCGTVCAALFDDGQAVTLIAMPDASYTFSGWSGDCSGTGPCSFTLAGANASVAARFDRLP